MASQSWYDKLMSAAKSNRVASGLALAAVGTALAWKLGAIEYMMAQTGLALQRASSRRRKSRRPEYIILIRHGQSLGNMNAKVHETMPDYRLPLTHKGKQQAQAAGRKLKEILGDRKIKFFVSPFRRANETLAHILRAFPDRDQYRIRVDPRLREQEFGNLQDSMRMENKILPMRTKFGKFFWRFQGGESGADVYDRVTSFLDTLYRDMDSNRRRRSDAVVIVSHGLTMRLLCMRYLRWSVAFFETVANPKNTEMWTLAKNHMGSYDLVTPIRRRRKSKKPLPVGRRSWIVNPHAFKNPVAWLQDNAPAPVHVLPPGRRNSFTQSPTRAAIADAKQSAADAKQSAADAKQSAADAKQSAAGAAAADGDSDTDTDSGSDSAGDDAGDAVGDDASDSDSDVDDMDEDDDDEGDGGDDDDGDDDIGDDDDDDDGCDDDDDDDDY